MEITPKIESLLFIAAKPMSTKQLADLLGAKENEIKEACEKLSEEYKTKQSGLQVIKDGNKYQMVSSPENAKLIQEFIKDETTGELSRPSLEALTIIAYRGPISKVSLDRIRGVNCSLILRNLLIRGLIEAKFDKTKNDTYYNVTLDFIRHLGVNSVEELPDFSRLHQDDTIDRVLAGVKDEVMETPN